MTHSLLVLRKRMSGAIRPNPMCCHDMYRDSFTLPLTYLSKCVYEVDMPTSAVWSVRQWTQNICHLCSSACCSWLMSHPPSGFHSVSLYSSFIVRIHWMEVWGSGNRMEEQPAYLNSYHLCIFILCPKCILGGLYPVSLQEQWTVLVLMWVPV